MKDPFTVDLCSFEMPIHLVLDGARAVNLRGADIERRLEVHGLIGRPLFRESTDRESKLAGPWLVPIGTNHAALAHSVSIARELGKGVFLLGEQNSEVLFRHLRRLGAASMPDSRILYFRYYDSDVLAAIVPFTNAQQASRVFGPTKVIGLIGGSGDGGFVERPEDLPSASSGPIVFEAWQIEALDQRQRILSRRKICGILRAEYPGETEHITDEDLYAKVANYENDARRVNLTSESSFLHWARINVETHDSMYRSKRLNEAITGNLRANADETFAVLTPGLIRAYRLGKHSASKLA